jgi:hypothetical protein
MLKPIPKVRAAAAKRSNSRGEERIRAIIFIKLSRWVDSDIRPEFKV